jgi:hypothetical protein
MSVTITSLYDRRADAQAACDQLRDRFGDGRFRIIDNNPNESDKEGFWARIKQAFLPETDRVVYGEGVRRGGYLLHAEVDGAAADGVCAILEQSPSVDLDARERSWRGEGWQPGPSGPDEGGGRRRTEPGSQRYRAYDRETPADAAGAAPDGDGERSAFSFGRERSGTGRPVEQEREASEVESSSNRGRDS